MITDWLTEDDGWVEAECRRCHVEEELPVTKDEFAKRLKDDGWREAPRNQGILCPKCVETTKSSGASNKGGE